MSREIKFRGFSYAIGGWLYGNLIEKDDPEKESPTPWVRLIHNRALSAELVTFDSVGQFTGLKDKNGKEIYEGDIVKDLGYFERLTEEQAMESGIAMIKYHQCGFIAHYKGIELFSVEYIDFDDRFEVIGNKYENPDITN